jgi:L-asparaginase / beta-aspartyl-peptidase
MARILTNSTAYTGLEAGARIAGNSGLDIVEAMVREVESDPEVHSVGLGSWPNMAGVLELDASIMNGTTLEAGSVCALKGFLHPISIAREVMVRLPHVMLAGDGAERFARESGAETADLLTKTAVDEYHAWIRRNVPVEVREQWPDTDLAPYATSSLDPEKTGGTTCVLVLDDAGNISAGVSTSGWAWKYPGRIGDSPVIGAGCYADTRYGAVGCIGTGEMAIRTATARSVVLYMKMGMSVEEACREAATDYGDLEGGIIRSVIIHAMDRNGEECVLSVGTGTGNGSGTGAKYYAWNDYSSEFEERFSESVGIRKR